MLSRAVSIAVAVVFLGASSAKADIPQAREASPGASVVKIIGYDANGRQVSGSGVVIAANTVATNCHVTRSAERIRVYVGNDSLTASGQRVAAERDLCVLSVPGLRAPNVKIGASRSLRAGDRVLALGYPNGGGLNGSRGEVLGLYQFEGGFAVQSTARFTNGCSGGGLFDSTGTLVGLLTFFRTADGHDPAYFAIPVELLGDLLKRAPESISPFAGIPFWAEKLNRQPVFLQATALEAAGMWSEMLEVARAWAAEEPTDHNAWRALARAAAEAGDHATAEEAQHHAVALGSSLP